MPDRATVNLDVDPLSQPKHATIARDDPFRILVLGDFSGRANRKLPLENPKPIDVDPDNFEQVMEALHIELQLAAGSTPLTLRFRELDDFDPDRLYQTLPLFQAFRDTRRRLEDPQTFRAAAARLRPDPSPAPKSGGSLLDQIADETSEPQTTPLRKPTSEWDEVIRRALAGHTIPSRDPRQDELIAQVDAAAASELRAILHHPDFQSLESAWRSLFLMFRRIETSVDLKIYLVDLSQAELADNPDILRRVLAGETPWSLIAALYTFSPNRADCETLGRIAKIAAEARAPFLAAMHPRLLGCESIASTPDPDDWDRPLAPDDAEAWQGLRHSPEAPWLGLAMPRFLLRLPYGKDTVPIESFDFEESPDHEGYLWANPSVACACLLGEAATWNAPTRIDGMPVDPDKPQAEIWMTDRLAARIMDQGIMPLASIKCSDAIQLVRFHSIADPPRRLAGPW